MKFGTWTNSDMKGSIGMFISSDFDWKYPFLEQILVQKNQKYLLKLKFKLQGLFKYVEFYGDFPLFPF